MHAFMQISSTPTAYRTMAANKDASDSETPKASTSELEKDINKTSSSDDPERDTVKEVVVEEPSKKRRKRQFSTNQTLITTYFKLTAASKAPSQVD